MQENKAKKGIGEYAEGELHRYLKFSIEPDAEYHEVEYLGSVADIMRGSHIYEIQTRSLSSLVPKLEKLLSRGVSVTVVHPLFLNKYTETVDAKTGEVSKRLSPKHASIYSAARELYGIRHLLGKSGLTVRLVFMTVSERRLKNTRIKLFGKYKKSIREALMPISVDSEINLSSREDYLALVPPELRHSELCAADINRAVGRGFSSGYSIIEILKATGLIKSERREGNRRLITLI